jgi:hypothetical protein
VLLCFHVALRTLANAVPLLGIQIRRSQFGIKRQTSGDLYPIAPLRKVDGANGILQWEGLLLGGQKLMANELQTVLLTTLEEQNYADDQLDDFEPDNHPSARQFVQGKEHHGRRWLQARASGGS